MIFLMVWAQPPALGTKTRLRELADIGFKPVALMVGETTFLALLVLMLLHYRFS